jgi:ribA/ribD-fused uncharacterized protein
MKEKTQTQIVFANKEEALVFCEKKGIKSKNIREYKLNQVIPFSSRVPGIHGYVFSNMYPCKLIWKDIEFNSVEQVFHYSCYKENPEMQKKILKCKNGFEVKKICTGVSRDADFKEKKFDILKSCLKLKFDQCEQFRTLLMSTGDIPLVEWAPWGDVEFGACKCMIDGKEYLIGANATGRTMMQIRLEHMETGA